MESITSITLTGEPQFAETVSQFDASQANTVSKTLLDNTLILKKELGSHVNNKENPHGVTKEQLGLENIENVTPENQEPVFTEALVRENIKSGEKIGLILGKVQKYFTDLKTAAFTGSFNDLTDKPVLGDIVSKQTANNCTTTEEGYVLDARQGQILRQDISQVKDGLWNHKASKSNPHGVTKEQLGLGNVQNEAPFDLLMTFSESAERENILSGEKLGTILGKIQKYFTDLKPAAFTGSYADLSGRPELGDASSKETANNCSTVVEGFVLDARQGRELEQEIVRTKSTLSEHSINKNNPHEVTKEQLGLGNVQNVVPAELVPSFTAASARENIKSGESLKILFGKISKFFTDLKPVAFSGSYGDLSGRPTLGDAASKAVANNCSTAAEGYVLDARQGKALQEGIHQVSSNLEQCFQSVSEGKAKVAAAITDRGVATAATDTFMVMADNIKNIKSIASVTAIGSGFVCPENGVIAYRYFNTVASHDNAIETNAFAQILINGTSVDSRSCHINPFAGGTMDLSSKRNVKKGDQFTTSFWMDRQGINCSWHNVLFATYSTTVE